MAMLQDAKSESIEQVLAYIRDRLPHGKAAMCAAFASEYYRLIAPEDLIERSPLDLYGAVMAHWNLAQHRAPRECKARVYTPQLEAHGWQSPHTVIELITDDMPFLVDSVSMEVTRQGYAIHLMVATNISVQRDDHGQLLEVFPVEAVQGSAITEALLHVEVDQQREPAVLDELCKGLIRVLGQVRAAVEDWPKMRHILQQLVRELDANPPPLDKEEIAEARDLLAWLDNENFIFLGYRSYVLLTESGEDRLGSDLPDPQDGNGCQPEDHRYGEGPLQGLPHQRDGVRQLDRSWPAGGIRPHRGDPLLDRGGAENESGREGEADLPLGPGLRRPGTAAEDSGGRYPGLRGGAAGH